MPKLAQYQERKTVYIKRDKIELNRKTNVYKCRTAWTTVKCVNEKHMILKLCASLYEKKQNLWAVRHAIQKVHVYPTQLSKGVPLDYYIEKHFDWCREYLCLGLAGRRKYEYEMKRRQWLRIKRAEHRKNAYAKARKWYNKEREASQFLGFDVLHPWKLRHLNHERRYQVIYKDGYAF